MARANAVTRTGGAIPDVTNHPLNSRTVPAAIAQAQRLLSLLAEHAPTVDKVGAPTQPLRACHSVYLRQPGSDESSTDHGDAHERREACDPFLLRRDGCTSG